MGLSMAGDSLEVLCLGAHPDDIEIGCGGTLLQLAARPGVRLTGAILTRSTERVAEFRTAFDLFCPGAATEVHDLPDGRLPAHWDTVKQLLEDLATRVSPQLVLAPRTDDAHQDHRLIGTLATTVWRNALVLHYEIPKWDGDMVSPTHFVGLTAEQAHRKVELLTKAYTSQVDRDWWDEEMFLGLMRIRGMESRHQYAEGFFTKKVLLDLTAQGDS